MSVYTVKFSPAGPPKRSVTATVALRPSQVVAVVAFLEAMRLRGKVHAYDLSPVDGMSTVTIGPDGRPVLAPGIMNAAIFFDEVVARELRQ